MQPQSTQVPPKPSRSTTATASPSCAARMAPTYPAGPPPTKITSYEAMRIGVRVVKGRRPSRRLGVSEYHQQRVLDQLPQGLQEARASCSIDHPMIATHRDPHSAANRRRAVDDHRSRLHRANGED